MSQKSRASSIDGTYSGWDVEGMEELRFTLEQLRDKPRCRTQKSLSSVEDLMEKHKKTVMEKEGRRRSQKSLDLQRFRFQPEISEKSKKINEPNYRREMEKMAEKIKAKKNPPPPTISNLRPSQVITAPDPTSVKVLFNKRSTEFPEKCKKPLKSSKSLSTMGILQKTEFFARKKRENQIKASLESEIKVMQNCTFKPNLSKSPEKRTSSDSMTEICVTEEKGKGGEILRPPAPNPKVKKIRESPSTEKKNYVKISPDEQLYAFKEGINLQKLLEKSKPLLKYKVANNPY